MSTMRIVVCGVLYPPVRTAPTPFIVVLSIYRNVGPDTNATSRLPTQLTVPYTANMLWVFGTWMGALSNAPVRPVCLANASGTTKGGLYVRCMVSVKRASRVSLSTYSASSSASDSARFRLTVDNFATTVSSSSYSGFRLSLCWCVSNCSLTLAAICSNPRILSMSLWVASTTAAALTSTLGGLYGMWEMAHSHRYCRSVSSVAANNCSSNTVCSTGAVSCLCTSPRLSHG
ncbi:ORF047L [Infectious spleen and kidney necrosis virus]|uniref:ORF047L n=1 Tax=Infectious spleen and kidney necrosis virus TaxID=180170 RepID=A0A140G0L9_ISKNV|nr:ORF047L [Infectious spleen and kidney necrosis virus]